MVHMPGLCTRPSIRIDSEERTPRMLRSSNPLRAKLTGLTPATVCSACCMFTICRDSICPRVITLTD